MFHNNKSKLKTNKNELKPMRKSSRELATNDSTPYLWLSFFLSFFYTPDRIQSNQKNVRINRLAECMWIVSFKYRFWNTRVRMWVIRMCFHVCVCEYWGCIRDRALSYPRFSVFKVQCLQHNIDIRCYSFVWFHFPMKNLHMFQHLVATGILTACYYFIHWCRCWN